jgi:hypothetical protein
LKEQKNNGDFSGVIPHLVDGGLSILQYVDDTILFIKHDLVQAKNLKLVLSAFEQLSGLKKVFTKGNYTAMGRPKTWSLSMHAYLAARRATLL